MIPRLCACLALLSATVAPAADWTTPAEATQFRQTPDYADTQAYLQRLAAAAPQRLRLVSMGRSPEGRELTVAVVASGGEFDPAAARASGKEIVFVQAGIHAGEIEGKDAGLMLLRDLALAKKPPARLERSILLYLPIFNVDGHERRSPYQRVNQNGPAQMGWRGTAQNLNLNRDYVKAEAPEMQAWLAFWNAWLPDLLVDVHTTDGADYQYDLTWYTEDWGNLHPAVKAWQDAALQGRVFPRTERRGHLLAPYLELVDHHDPAKGIGNFGSGPRYSTGYAALQNRAGLLLETHMLKPYGERVRATYDLLAELLREFDVHPGALRRATTQADADTAALAGQPAARIPLRFEPDGRSVPFTFKGYAYTQTPSTISGDRWTQYDPRHRRTLTVPWFRDLRVSVAAAPPAAYVIPAAWGQVIDKLAQHGVRTERLAQAQRLPVRAWRLAAPQWSAQPFENRLMLTSVQVSDEAREETLAAGSVLVPMDQRAARVAAHLLEPEAPDALLRWGWFNVIFEQREYADARVAERIARELLAQRPQLQAEFDAALKDPAFAASPQRRLDFFFERSPWHDERLGLYPVLRLDADALRRVRAAEEKAADAAP
ncbi:MAG TPA: M14 family metallopeptidase [Rhodanobacteraceae bacterium]|nr:M14 family metallopeptidase [Rhodanobacteraceae bacterium]